MSSSSGNFQKLKEALGSRVAEEVLDGMKQLLEINVDRLEDAIETEVMTGTTNSHVTKMISDVMSQAEKIAKLRNPNLGQPATGPAPALPPNMTEAQLTREVVSRMAELGIPRNAITPEMIEAVGRDVTQGVSVEEAVRRQVRALAA